MSESIGLEQAAQILEVHRDTVKRLVDSGRLPGWRTPGRENRGGHRRVALADVLRLRAELREPAKATAGD